MGSKKQNWENIVCGQESVISFLISFYDKMKTDTCDCFEERNDVENSEVVYI